MANQKKNTTKKKYDSKMLYQFRIWVLILTIVLIFLNLLIGDGGADISWQYFKNNMLANNHVEKLEVVNKEEVSVYIKEELLGKDLYKDYNPKDTGPHYHFNIGSVEVFEQKLDKAQQEYHLTELPEVNYKTSGGFTIGVLLAWAIPLLILALLWFTVLKQMPSSGGSLNPRNPFDFGKSKVKAFDGAVEKKVSFKDVAGMEGAKEEVMEIVDFLKKPEYYTRLGAKIPQGVMLVGPPGTGKTLLAKAVAGESGVPFFSITGSSFIEMFVGVGASRVRDLFKKAKDKAPSIIFIDEIDAVGRARGKAFALQSNDERDSTLNQLLSEMDGFDANSGVIVMAATNRPDVLDKALLRPGRFDRHIYLELPNITERQAIFEVHTKHIKLADDFDIKELAALTPGFSGADIANLSNEAALIAARQEKEAVYQAHFSEALDRIIGGIERKGKVISAREKNIIAHHEAGHATVSWFLKNMDELLKVSIVPRGKSLGAAWYLPEEHHLMTYAQFMDRICTALGGRVAEEIMFKEVSSGALDDLEKVTKLAYTMVAYYGLDEEIGHRSFYDSTGQNQQMLYKPYSEATAQLIDERVDALIKKAYQKTKDILLAHQIEMKQLADLLLQKEVVDREGLESVFGVKQRTPLIPPNSEKKEVA